MFSVLWHKAILSLGAGAAAGILDSLAMWGLTKLAFKTKGRSAQVIMALSSAGRILVLGFVIVVIIKLHILSPGWFIAGLLPITFGKFIITANALRKYGTRN
jgi:hypothetical protein